jgi:hypothetical protein
VDPANREAGLKARPISEFLPLFSTFCEHRARPLGGQTVAAAPRDGIGVILSDVAARATSTMLFGVVTIDSVIAQARPCCGPSSSQGRRGGGRLGRRQGHDNSPRGISPRDLSVEV